MPRITKKVVDAAEPMEKRYTVFDDQVPGFGLRVFPTGSKSWIFEYRGGNGGRSAKKERITLGKVGDLTPDQARKLADHHRAVVKTGGDPQGEKSAWRKSMSLKQIADEFLQHIKEDRSPKTYESYESALRLHVLPTLGSKKARDVTHADMERVRLSLRSKPPTANNVLRVVSALYNYSANQARQWVPKGTNPASDLERYPEHVRKVSISDEQLLRLGETIRLAETEGLPWTIDETKKNKHLPKNLPHVTVYEPAVTNAFRLLALTGARLREILGLKWENVDLKENTAKFNVHKTARTTGEKTIVLNDAAVAVLQELAKTRRGAYVIEGENAGEPNEAPRSDLNRPWRAIREHAGLSSLRIHDLRHIFGNAGASADMGLPMIGALLGHASTQSTMRYAHAQRNPQRNASQRIGEAISGALGEAKAKKARPTTVKQ